MCREDQLLQRILQHKGRTAAGALALDIHSVLNDTNSNSNDGSVWKDEFLPCSGSERASAPSRAVKLTICFMLLACQHSPYGMALLTS